jgi:hypothetical protein
MSNTQKPEAESWWARLARKTEQERAQESAQAAQDRAERTQAEAEERQSQPAQRRRRTLRP